MTRRASSRALRPRLLRSVACAALLALVFCTPAARAQPVPGECYSGACGTPRESGGGGGGGGGGSILINNTDLGDTYQYGDDVDGDGWEDPEDNCPYWPNIDQVDGDGDAVGDACDNCPSVPNADQRDTDGDLAGDACDDDGDGDTVADASDLCPLIPDPTQTDTDGDRLGNACDGDDDGDGYDDAEDNCPLVANPDQLNSDPDTYGDQCDADHDDDEIPDSYDNCAAAPNPDQADADGDGLGDGCDADADNDGVLNAVDSCPLTPNRTQSDGDLDGAGNDCDPYLCFEWNTQDDCLDPAGAFAVGAAAFPQNRVATGQGVRLRLFSNRESLPIRYVWQLVAAPDGSRASIRGAQGAVSESTPWEYHYADDALALFEPDEPGDYTFRVRGELMQRDPLFPDITVAEAQFTLVAEGEAVGSDKAGCSAAAGAAGPGALALWFGFVGWAWAVRRRARAAHRGVA